jgi:Zn-finger nucleic acid-binding protein
MHLMECPACKEPLIVLEYDQVEVDYCAACHGVWLDAGELELLFGNRAMTDGFLAAGDPQAAAGEKPRPCPICGKAMAKRVTGGAHPVVYDQCVAGHGQWFDRGELHTVLKYGSSAAGGDAVGAWLREIFQAEVTEAGE